MIHDPETERAVLGCCLMGSKPSETGLPPEAFTEARRHVWEAMQALEAERIEADCLTVAERLKARGRLHECGGPHGLIDLTNGVAMTWNLPAYVGILQNRMLRRRLEETAANLKRAAEDLGADPVTAAAGAATSLGAIRGERRLKRAGNLVYRLADKWAHNIEAAANGKQVIPCLPWPHIGMVNGPPRGRVSIVAGRSGNFKSGLVSDGAWFWAHSLKEPGGIIGLEDGCDWWTERLAARATGVDYGDVGYVRIDDGQQTALGNWCAYAHDTLEARVFYEDYSEEGDATSSISFPEVFGVIQRMTEAGAKWIVIDHGLRIDWLKGARVERYDMAIGQGMARCSRYAERTGVALIFLWHLNRAQQEGSIPQRSDLKESGYVDAEARRIDILWKQASRPGFQMVTTVKATKGEEGVTVALPLTDARFGLLARTGGHRVDFEAEEQERRGRAAAEKAAKSGKRARLFGGGDS